MGVVVSSRRSRRVLGLLGALSLSAGLVMLSSCATGGSGETAEGGGGEPEAGGNPEAAQGDGSKPPPGDGGSDTGKVDSGGGDTGPADTGAKDTTTKDTTPPPVDTGPPDTGPVDTGPPCTAVTVSDAGGAPTGCTPLGSACGDIGSFSFSPSAIPPNPVDSTACTTTEIDAIYTACLGATGSSAACTKVQSTDATCYSCIFSQETATSYGPAILTSNGGLVLLNQAGCIDLLEPCNSGCGEAYQSLTQCELAACEPNCPSITTSAEDTSFQGCFNAVATCDPGGCASYLIEADNCQTSLKPKTHPASVCVGTSTSTFPTLFKAIVPVFCGP